MCVILCFEKDYPTQDMLDSAEDYNSDGGGMAWIENGKVHYRKGIKGKEMMEIIEKRKIKLPFILHFRIASVGKVSTELCHPFPIQDGVPLDKKGVVNGVVFHNGNWTGWREWIMKTVVRKKIKMPRNIWSDSRGLAFLAHHYGIDVLNTINTNKIAVLTKDGIQRFGERWDKIGKVVCSNDNFKRTTVDTNWSDDDGWADTYGGSGCMGFEGYYKHGAWHDKDEQEKKQLSLEIDESIEEEIEKGLENATKEENDNEIATADQITRNAIRKGIEEQIEKMPIKQTQEDNPQQKAKAKSNITTSEYIDKYDKTTDEVIAEEYYHNLKFRKKFEHKSNFPVTQQQQYSERHMGRGRGVSGDEYPINYGGMM